jgi:hypothetical protein
VKKCKDKGISSMSNSAESKNMPDILSYIPTDPNVIKVQVDLLGEAKDILAILA